MSAPAPEGSNDGRVATKATLGFEDVQADDGTRIRVWTNDLAGAIDGPTVLLCNGLGAGARAWPALLDPGCGVRVVSWHHRGTGGSARPADPQRVGVEDFVHDALSVLDHFGLERVVVMGWSVGVNTAFELALHHPERVAGVFAVAGVPGDTFASMLGPLRLPRRLARRLVVGLARAVQHLGWALTPILSRLPVGPAAVRVLSHSGFMLPVPDPRATALALRELLAIPVGWYLHLALRTAAHARVSLSGIDVPAFLIGGRWDIVSSARDMAAAAALLRESTYVELSGSHFLPLEKPDVVHRLLLEFLERVR